MAAILGIFAALLAFSVGQGTSPVSDDALGILSGMFVIGSVIVYKMDRRH